MEISTWPRLPGRLPGLPGRSAYLLTWSTTRKLSDRSDEISSCRVGCRRREISRLLGGLPGRFPPRFRDLNDKRRSGLTPEGRQVPGWSLQSCRVGFASAQDAGAGLAGPARSDQAAPRGTALPSPAGQPALASPLSPVPTTPLEVAKSRVKRVFPFNQASSGLTLSSS